MWAVAATHQILVMCPWRCHACTGLPILISKSHETKDNRRDSLFCDSVRVFERCLDMETKKCTTLSEPQ